MIVPIAATGLFTSLASETGEVTNAQAITGVIFTFLFYFVTYTITIYCNSALVGAALIRLNGGDPTLKDGFRIDQFLTMTEMANVERVEVLKGPVGALYGRNEPGGIVNVVTKTPQMDTHATVGTTVIRATVIVVTAAAGRGQRECGEQEGIAEHRMPSPALIGPAETRARGALATG